MSGWTWHVSCGTWISGVWACRMGRKCQLSALTVLVPGGGGPASIGRLMDACRKTCRADTRLHFGFDIDDPAVRGNLDAADWPDALVSTGPRDTLTGRMDKLAIRHLADAPAVDRLGEHQRTGTVGRGTLGERDHDISIVRGVRAAAAASV